MEIREYAKKFEESKKWLLTTLISLGEAVIVTDRLGNIQFVNPIAEDLTGYESEKSIGKPLEDVFNIRNEETRKSVESPVSRVIREGAIVGLANHTVLITQEGKEILIAGSGAPIKDDKGNDLGVVLTFRDITENVQAEQALRESEHNLGERVKELTCLYGLSKIVENPDISSEAILRGALNLIPPAWQFPEITCAKINFNNKEFKTSNFKETEWKLSTKINVLEEEMIIEVYYLEDKPFLNEEEHLISDIGKRLKSIIEQRKTHQKLRVSEEWFSTTLKSIGDAVIATDRMGNIQFVNPIAEDLTGYESEKSIGKPLEDIFNIINEETRKSVESPVSRVIREGAIVGLANHTVLISKEGIEIPIADSGAPIKDDKGNLIGVVLTFRDITENVQAEQALRESEHNLGERVKELTCLYGLSKIVENPDISSEAILRGALNLIPPAWQFPEITCAKINFNNKEFKTSNFKETEWKLSTKINVLEEEMIIEVYYLEDKPFLNEEEHLISDIGKRLKSIIEQRKTHQKLRVSEEWFSTTLKSIGDAVIATDRMGNIQFVNPIAEDLTGYESEKSIGKPLEDIFNIINEETRKSVESPVSRVIREGAIVGLANHTVLISKEGIEIPIADSGAPIKDDKGNLIGVVLTFRDITENREKEKEIFDLAQFPSEDPFPILRVNINDVIYINEAGQKLLNIVEHSQIPKIFQESVKNTFENKKVTESEVELDNRIYAFIVTPIKDADYVNIYGMDITERKHIEKKLREVNKLKSEFLRRASHELKTPLISIKGFSDLILSLYEDQLDAVIVSKLKEIDVGCERLQNIINNLLKTSKLESTDLKPKVQKEDLSFLIKFCVHELESLAERRKQSIKLDIHNEIYTYFEKEEIHDALSNLITNAIKYTPPMGNIEIKTELTKESVLISIKDNGIGFTEEQKSKIFQQFGKIERYGQGLDLGIDGTGLGLYISKKIVESHGGKIWMESEGKDKGSTFYFSLPKLIK